MEKLRSFLKKYVKNLEYKTLEAIEGSEKSIINKSS